MTKWDMEPMGTDIAHVIPVNDLLAHEHESCACLPFVQPHQRDDGSYGWVVIHSAWDGRDE